MNESTIYKKLEFLREQFITGELKPCVDLKLKIDGQIFNQNVWVEPHESGKLVVVMLELNDFIISHNYCLGLIVAKNGSIEYLDNEKLWDIGIP